MDELQCIAIDEFKWKYSRVPKVRTSMTKSAVRTQCAYRSVRICI